MPANPHGHGFMAATSWNRAGKIAARPTRAIATRPSSIGWRSASRTSRPNSGSSSRKRTPWSARVTSPGDRCGPPPTIAAYETVWCGDRNGGRRRSSWIGPSPAADATTVAASAAASSSGGSRPGIVRPGASCPTRADRSAAGRDRRPGRPPGRGGPVAWPRTSSRSGTARPDGPAAGAGLVSSAPSPSTSSIRGGTTRPVARRRARTSIDRRLERRRPRRPRCLPPAAPRRPRPRRRPRA